MLRRPFRYKTSRGWRAKNPSADRITTMHVKAYGRWYVIKVPQK